MRLWSIQSQGLYEKLKTEKIIHYDLAQSELLTECGFAPAYDWMAGQMRRRIGPPPAGVKYPFWAWHTLDWIHRKHDLRRGEFRGYKLCQRPGIRSRRAVV